MRLDLDWLDELDENELEVDQSADDVLSAETEPWITWTAIHRVRCKPSRRS